MASRSGTTHQTWRDWGYSRGSHPLEQPRGIARGALVWGWERLDHLLRANESWELVRTLGNQRYFCSNYLKDPGKGYRESIGRAMGLVKSLLCLDAPR